MSALELYAIVKVVSASRAENEYDGWCLNTRPPKNGDIGTLIDVLKIDSSELYVVESVDIAGNTVWLSEFMVNEIEMA